MVLTFSRWSSPSANARAARIARAPLPAAAEENSRAARRRRPAGWRCRHLLAAVQGFERDRRWLRMRRRMASFAAAPSSRARAEVNRAPGRAAASGRAWNFRTARQRRRSRQPRPAFRWLRGSHPSRAMRGRRAGARRPIPREEAAARDGDAGIPEPSERQVAQTGAHRIAYQERAAEHSRSHGHASSAARLVRSTR